MLLVSSNRWWIPFSFKSYGFWTLRRCRADCGYLPETGTGSCNPGFLSPWCISYDSSSCSNIRTLCHSYGICFPSEFICLYKTAPACIHPDMITIIEYVSGLYSLLGNLDESSMRVVIGFPWIIIHVPVNAGTLVVCYMRIGCTYEWRMRYLLLAEN